MNHLFLPIALIVVYYLAAIANLVSGFITNFSAEKDESEVLPPASNLTLLVSSLGVFLVWLGLGYLNTRFMGFYSLLGFYGLILLIVLLPYKHALYTYAVIALSLWIYPELFVRYHEVLGGNTLKAIGLLTLVFSLSIVVAIFWLLFSGIGFYGFVFAIANRKQDTEDESNNLQIGFVVKSLILGFLVIGATIPVLISLLQANLLGIAFSVMLWININFTLTNSLLFGVQKTTDKLATTIPRIWAKSSIVILALSGLVAGYLLSPTRLYVYQTSLLWWMAISLAIIGLFIAILLLPEESLPSQEN